MVWLPTNSSICVVVGAFLKNAWNKEPVVTASCAIGLLGEFRVKVCNLGANQIPLA